MAGYVLIGSPYVHTGIVNENAGLGGGKFVALAPATGKVTLAEKTTTPAELYFTEDVDHGDYVGSDATSVVAKNDSIGICKLLPGMEIVIAMTTTGLTTAGTALVLADGGVVGAVPATAGTYTVIGFVKEAVVHNGVAGLAIRIVEPYAVTVQ